MKREPRVGDRLKIGCGTADLMLKVVDVKEEKRGFWIYCEPLYKVAGIKSFSWEPKDIEMADWYEEN